jgi:biopolymer transport protein TolQ
VNPDLSQDLSLFHLVLNASLPVQIVMALLLGASLMSWWFIFIKMFALKRALRVTDAFEHEFWGGADLNLMFKRVAAEREQAGEMERIFEAVPRIHEASRQAGLSLNVVIDGTCRAMRATYQRELDGLESHLVSRHRRFGVALCRPVRHGVGIMLAFLGLSRWRRPRWRKSPPALPRP